VVPNFYVFHSEDFSYAGESDERGNYCPSGYSLLRQKFYGMVIGIEKNKSTVHGEISKCALTRCSATSRSVASDLSFKILKISQI